MCGRFNVIEDPLSRFVSEQLNLNFRAPNNPDVRPTNEVQTIIARQQPNGFFYEQHAMNWGIQPEWAKKLIINARAETLSEKRMFSQALQSHRCVIPMSGWYEWRDEGAPRKQKYLFSESDNKPLYMAGIWFERPDNGLAEVVSVTIAPNQRCQPYHHRMPFLILPENVGWWLAAPTEQLPAIMAPVVDDMITVEAA